jgi:RNA polymerase sigma factor (sigma-70 family)
VPPEPKPDVERLVQDEEPLLRAYLRRRLRVGDDVDDYVQEVYARVLATPPSRPVRSWQGMLRRIAANLIIDGARNARRQASSAQVRLDDDWEVGDDRPSAEASVIARERLSKVIATLEEASPIARSVFLLVRVEGLTHREAAARLGIEPKVASRHVERVLLLISRRLAETLRP